MHPRLRPRALAPLAALALAACSATPDARTPRTVQLPQAPERPMLRGLPVYPAALEAPALRGLWADAEDLRHDAPPDLRTTPLASARADLGPWVQRRLTGLRALATAARNVTAHGTPADRVFAAVVYADAADNLRAEIEGLTPPAALDATPDGITTWRETLREVAAPITREAESAWRACAVAAPQGPASTQPWTARCRELADTRAMELRPVAAPSPASNAAPANVTIPPECEGGEYVRRSPEPEAPPPDESHPREVAVVCEDALFDAHDCERLTDAVHGFMASRGGVALVPRDEVRAAVALHDARRIRPDGPVCGQAPPLAAILAQRHPNLIIASVETWCGQFVDGSRAGRAPEQRSLCTLQVHQRRAGTANRAGLPDDVGVNLDAPRGSVNTWIDAVPRMTPNGAMASVFGALVASTRRAEFRVLGYADDDPWLRIGSTLYGRPHEEEAREALLACATRAGGVGSYRLAWTVSPTGDTTDAAVSPLTAPLDGSGERVAACVRERLGGVAWPCPRSGQPVRVEARLCIGWR